MNTKKCKKKKCATKSCPKKVEKPITATSFYSKKVMDLFQNPKNVGEIKDFDGKGVVGNPACLIKGSFVQANFELTEIENIQPSKNVLSHDGLYHTVNANAKTNFSGKTIELKNQLGLTQLTPDHEIFAIKLPKHESFLRNKFKKTIKAEWHPASNLDKGDILLYPILKETRDRDFIPIDLTKKKFDFKSKEIPNKIKIDEKFLKLAGFYLAEGHCILKTTKVHLGFSFALDEQEFADEVKLFVKEIFGIETKERKNIKHNTISLAINNVFIARLFNDLFGKGAKNKKIPEFMLYLPVKKQSALLAGMWLGDGFFNKKIPRAGYSTISPVLVNQLKTLLLRQEISPSIYVEKEKKVNGVNHKQSFRIHVGERNSVLKLASILGIKLKVTKEKATRSWFNENYLFTPITGKTIKSFNGEVFDIAVNESHSFATNSLIAHNCGDIMELTIKVEKNKIKDIKFKTFGCAAAIATSSMITELAKGKTLEQALKITRGDVAESLDGLPPIKMHCSNLAADALHAAIEDYKKRKKS